MRIRGPIRLVPGPARPSGGVALAALLSGAFVITAGFGGPIEDRPSTSTASAETCSLQAVTPSTVVAGLAEVHPTFAVAVSGCTATWSIGWPATGAVATQHAPLGSIDVGALKNSSAGRSDLYVTLRGDDDTSNRTPVPVTLKQRTVWGPLAASPAPGSNGRRLAIASVLGRADWDAAAYRGFAGRTVTVAFRAAGTSAFVPVRTVGTGVRGKLRFTVPAGRAGAWRVEFAGSALTAPASSQPVTIPARSGAARSGAVTAGAVTAGAAADPGRR